MTTAGSSPLRVLLIEDSSDDAVLLARELRRYGFSLDLQRVETPAQLSAALDSQLWDIIIADWNLPHIAVLPSLDLLHERGLDIPLIVISGAIAEDLAVTALRAGAQDFIRKGNWARLGPAIERELAESANRRERKRADDALRFLAESNRVLTESLDYAAIAQNVVLLAVPFLGQSCTLSIRLTHDAPDHLVTSCANPNDGPTVDGLIRRYLTEQRRAPNCAAPTSRASALVVTDLTGQGDAKHRVSDEVIQSLRVLGGQMLVSAPLVRRRQDLGDLVLVTSKSEGRFDLSDRALIEEFSHRVAGALDNALLYVAEREARGEAERAVDRISRLQSMTVALSSAATLDAVSRVLVDVGMTAIGADAGLLALSSAGSRAIEITVKTGFLDEGYEPITSSYERSSLDNDEPIGDAIRTGRIVCVASRAERVARYPQTRPSGFEAMLAVPLRAEGHNIGALGLSFRSVRHFDRAELDYIQTVADQCAQSFERARLYEAERSAVRARDEFLSVAAHELRTPITSLVLQAQLAQRRIDRTGVVDAEREVQAFRTINQQAEKAAQLIGQLLDISRIDGGRLKLIQLPTDVTNLVDGIVRATRDRATDHTITLRAGEPIVTSVDALRLEQVITNLVENAIKYSPHGGEIDLEVSSPSADRVAIAVTDRGVGIAPEHRPYIFDRYYQAHADSHLSGLGLGLYISRQIIELHGGRIWAEFPDGGGSRFGVELPVS